MRLTTRLLILCCSLAALSMLLPGCNRACAPDDLTATVITPTPSAAPTPTPSPTPSFTPTPSPTPTPDGLLGGRFADLLTTDTVGTETSYGCLSRYVSMTDVIQQPVYVQRSSDVLSYYIADIYVQDVESIRTEAAAGGFALKGQVKPVKDMSERVNAIVAVSGDYYIHDKNGVVFRNGELFRSRIHERKDLCVLYRDGTMQTYLVGAYSLDEILANDPWQIWSFGPALLDENGEPKTEFNSSLTGLNPRCAIGYYEPGHYCFVIVDGRQRSHSVGINMSGLSQLMHDLGCVVAYNLDGGASAQIYWNGEIHNEPSGGGRSVSDIIYVAFPTE